MKTAIESFAKYLQDVGYSKNIQERLPAMVAEFSEQQELASINNIEQQQVKEFFEYLQTRPLKRESGALSEAMISYYAYALRTFFNWLETTQQIVYNPISGIKFKKAKINSREPLSQQQIQELFKAASTLKETALLHIFYSCGLRKSEGVKLNITDIHFISKLLYVREGKGCKRRVVPLTEKVAKDLERYYEQERQQPIVPIKGSYMYKQTETSAFLLDLRGGRMSGQSCGKLLKQLLEKAGLSKQISLHHLRHSIATHLLQSGMSMEYVKEFLGHGHLETTQIYAKPKAEQLKLF